MRSDLQRFLTCFGLAFLLSFIIGLLVGSCNPFVPGAHPQGLTPCVANDSGPRVRDSSGACVRRAP